MRYYSSIAQAAQLSGGVTGLVTSIAVSSLVGFPTSVPFTIAVDPSTAYEEIMTVTVVSGTSLTVTRGEDSSTAVAHSAGAAVRHVMSARDLREPQEHITATGNVHGVGAGSSIVGTETAQVLTNKIIDGATNTVQNLDGEVIATGTVAKERLPAATLTAAGVSELATNAETLDGTDATRATTPVGVKAAIDARTATDAVAGIVELATTAEAVTGTDTARAVTPAGVNAAIADAEGSVMTFASDTSAGTAWSHVG